MPAQTSYKKALCLSVERVDCDKTAIFRVKSHFLKERLLQSFFVSQKDHMTAPTRYSLVVYPSPKS